MPEKYDLKRMMREIREDEAFAGRKDEGISQADILRMIQEKKKERTESGD